MHQKEDEINLVNTFTVCVKSAKTANFPTFVRMLLHIAEIKTFVGVVILN